MADTSGDNVEYERWPGLVPSEGSVAEGYPCPKDGATLTLMQNGAWCPTCHTVWREVAEVSVTWTAQPNDLIGGAVVTTYPRPMSEHDHRRDGDPSKRGYVIAECMTMADAGTIADLLNGAGIHRELPHSGRSAE